MSSRPSPSSATHCAAQDTRGAEPPELWQTLEQRERPASSPGSRTDEFPPDASFWPPEVSRRRFLEVMGASLAMAGASGCAPHPDKQIVPYVTAPEQVVPGKPLFFATAMPWQGYARGVLAESHLGRPTKLEGNPDHPDSLGATDTVTQAGVLGLYDPDRSRVPLHDQSPVAWETFEDAWLGQRRPFSENGGTGLALLTEPTTSPTVLRGIHRLLDQFPNARWYQHTALPRFDREGQQLDFDPAAADVILSIGDDFLYSHPASLRYARAYAKRRRVVGNDRPLSRLYVLEPTPSVTGTMADHRLPISPARIAQVVFALAANLGVPGLAANAGGELDEAERDFVRSAARDLRASEQKAIVLAGPEMDDPIHHAVAAINARLAAGGPPLHPGARAAVRSDGDPRAAGMLPDLVEVLAAGGVHALLILGCNPVYTAPADVDFGAALPRAGFTVHMGPYVDETAVRCNWHLPESHFLESWSDLRAYDGTASIVQPLIAPLFRTRTLAEVIHFCAKPPGQSDYDLVRATWQQLRNEDDFDHAWNEWLRSGVIPNSAANGNPPAQPGAPAQALKPPSAVSHENGYLLLRADPNVQDGRWINNAWLQEIPRPISHIVWDNAALVSPPLARRLELNNSDIITIETKEGSLDVAVWIQPGQAEDCITLHLGYGREHTGSVGRHVGVNAYRLRTRASLWQAPITAVHRRDRRGSVISTQGHFQMEGRDIVRMVTPDRINQDIAEPESTHPRLFPGWEDPRYAWGMVIDLSTCIGCNACTIACQAENNIPVVGKDQVARGREMHWIRIDRYYAGEPEHPRLVQQPVPCMQCETAPCELVCPVGATLHSNEGLNDMVYNRCIGTRYCSNNCPYKVRRFNFLDFQVPTESLLTLQKNPDVTVRARGVMEKCTYCVQRINAARITASEEKRLIRDGEVRTACQQVCPTEAIVFGDLHAPDSQIAALRQHPLNYALLPDLNTRPRTTYLARVLNPGDLKAEGELV